MVPGYPGLDWDRVLAGIASSLAGANGRALLKPDYLAEAMSKTRGMLAMLEVASWEDHVEDMLRPQFYLLPAPPCLFF